VSVPELYRIAVAITSRLEQMHPNDPIGLIRAKGALATKTGFLVSLISPHDPDDSEKVACLRKAAVEMGIAL